MYNRETHAYLHTYTHMHVQSHWEIALWVCKFDRDLADSGHLALAAEQTGWFHLYVCVCVLGCVCMCVSLQEETRKKTKKMDAHNDLTAANQQEAQKKCAFRFTTSFYASWKFLHLLLLNLPSSHLWKENEHMTWRWAHGRRLACSTFCQKLSTSSITLTQQHKTYLILGFAF